MRRNVKMVVLVKIVSRYAIARIIVPVTRRLENACVPEVGEGRIALRPVIVDTMESAASKSVHHYHPGILEPAIM